MTMTPQTAANAAATIAQGFAAFWDKPDAALVKHIVTPDVAGYWPWSATPVRGVDAYVKVIADLIVLIPGLRLDVAEQASNGEFVFIRWVAQGNAAHGKLGLTGIDRLRLRDGVVAENIICFDSERLRKLAGRLPVLT